jgi:hypothetical protein
MKINAYVLAGDPAFLASSVTSYYDAVDRIVVLYDRDHLSWSGQPLRIAECLAELRHVDPNGKIDPHLGSFARPDLPPIEGETLERREAVALASQGADWVLQLDSDEVVPDLAAFIEMVVRADASGADALDYPSRWLYARTRHGGFLEGCSRWWRAAAAFPGPLAIRAGSTLSHARQCDGKLFRVDFRGRNTDPWRDRRTPVHSTVPVEAGVLHFSWVRSEADLVVKSRVSGHRDGVDWAHGIARWRFQTRHPRVAVALTPLRRRGALHPTWLRETRLPIEAAERVGAAA